MNRPIIVLVPGFWEGPDIYEEVMKHLESCGFACFPMALRSTGHAASNPPKKNPSFNDDVESIRQALKGLVSASKDIVMVLHSAGGFIGSSATEGFSHNERKAAGRRGGILKMIFLAGGVWAEGTQLGDEMYCKSPRELLFNDLPDDKAEAQITALQCQPARNWNEKVQHCGWRHTENAYLLCEKDKCIPSAVQPGIAQQLGSSLTETIDAGHMALVSQPDAVAQFVLKAVGDNAIS